MENYFRQLHLTASRMKEEYKQLILNKWNIRDYLKRISPDRFNSEPRRIEELKGGIINSVYRVDFDSEKIVLKQALANAKSRYVSCKLNPNRVVKEYEAIRIFKKYAKADFLPKPIFIDRKNYVMAVENVPDPYHTLKRDLIDNMADAKIAENIVKNLSLLHNSTMEKEEIHLGFDNRENFMNLKIKLQCLEITKNEILKREISRFVINSIAKKICLLHGDIAPKNILVHGRKVFFIDLEESYYSDPALDVGYLLAHYFLNAINNLSLEHFYDAVDRMWKTYLDRINLSEEDFRKRIVKYIGIFLLSRIDGQAKANQVKNEKIKQIIRDTAKDIILRDYGDLEDVKNVITLKVKDSFSSTL